MTENELRQKVLAVARGWIGRNEADGTHKKIIDIYNGQTPLPVGYKVQYTDAWCATTVSAVFIKAGLTAIAPTECSCPRMVELYKTRGLWMENDAHVPKPGDIVMYDWQDSGSGDNVGNPDHVGIVESVSGGSMQIIEGNYKNGVNRRTLAVNGKYIRGYCLPDYSAAATEAEGSDGLDNTPSEWAEDAVKWAQKKGLMMGDDKGNLKLHDPVTREQLMVFLYRFKDMI